ncbi:hypothetical protein ACLOJK_003910 [Asimina triloba]
MTITVLRLLIPKQMAQAPQNHHRPLRLDARNLEHSLKNHHYAFVIVADDPPPVWAEETNRREPSGIDFANIDRINPNDPRQANEEPESETASIFDMERWLGASTKSSKPTSEGVAFFR